MTLEYVVHNRQEQRHATRSAIQDRVHKDVREAALVRHGATWVLGLQGGRGHSWLFIFYKNWLPGELVPSVLLDVRSFYWTLLQTPFRCFKTVSRTRSGGLAAVPLLQQRGRASGQHHSHWHAERSRRLRERLQPRSHLRLPVSVQYNSKTLYNT